MTRAYIIDTETTGTEETDEVIEMAYGGYSDNLQTVGEITVVRYLPTKKISWGAMATHHIIPSDFKDIPVRGKVVLPKDCEYIIGHNIDFDWRMLGSPNVKRICTLAMARAANPTMDSHSLGARHYFIAGANEQARDAIRGAHSAGCDVQLCANLLEHLLVQHYPSVMNIEDLWGASQLARVPTVWAFGKFKGQPIDAADRGYLNWCIKQPDMDEYVKIACRMALEL